MHLTIRNRDKKLLILKEISMGAMTSEERSLAKNEVQILKVKCLTPRLVRIDSNRLNCGNQADSGLRGRQI